MMHRGYIKLWRKSIDTGMLSNHKLWVFWSWCLMKASHKEFKQIIGYREIILKPGQFIFGRKKAAKELKMSEQNIRTCLNFLKTHQNLTIKTTNKYSIITIVNWDIYQQEPCQNNHQSNQQLTNNQPTTNQQLTTNKNDKNIKNEKNEKNITTLAQNFNAFWSAYPKKKSKGQAEKAFKKIKPDENLMIKILNSIDQAKQSYDWQKESGKYIPYPATWLNAQGWDDEYQKLDTRISETMRHNLQSTQDWLDKKQKEMQNENSTGSDQIR